MKKIFLFLITLSAGLISCNREEPAKLTGGLSFNVTGNTDYILVTKSGTDYSDINNYDVVIDGPTKVSEKYAELTGRVVELGSGKYTITITSPGTLPAAFNQPIYQATESFEIRAGEVTALDLVCKPANTMVSIELSDNFKKELATYEVVVNNGLDQLVWTKDQTKDDFAANLVGYFLPRGLEVKVKGHRSIDNTMATAVYYIENPKAAEHHIIKLDAKVTGQIGGITIQFETTFNEVSNDIHMDGLDESYVDRPDFGDSDDDDEVVVSNNPSIIWAENPFFDPISIQKGDEISLTIKAPLGIKTFRVEVSDNFKPAVSMIAQKDYIDLVNDVDIWAPFGLPVGDAVAGQTELVFELTPFIDTLCGAAAGLTVQFILLATDTEDNEVLINGETPVVTINVPA
jgi:hypothetical protein